MKMYQGMMDSGCFEDGDRTIMEIVDNDVINWCTIIYEDDDIFNKLIEAYNNGEYEVDGYCIEVVDDLNNPTMILARC